MKKTLITIALTSALAVTSFVSTSVHAVEGLSANAAVTNNYLWRGVTQTDGAPAVYGGIDYNHASGFYAGTWVSNVDFGDSTDYELDFYTGYDGEFGDSGVGYGVGYIYYAYPQSAQEFSDNEYDFGEIYGSLSYGFFSVSAHYGIHNDDGADFADKSLYISTSSEFEISDGLTLNLHIGHYSFDVDMYQDYADYSIALRKNGFTFGVSDTDLDNEDPVVFVSYALDFDL